MFNAMLCVVALMIGILIGQITGSIQGSKEKEETDKLNDRLLDSLSREAMRPKHYCCTKCRKMVSGDQARKYIVKNEPVLCAKCEVS